MNDKNLFELGVAAAEAGDKEKAREFFLKVVEQDPQHEKAWIWLCDLVDDPDDRIIALENALTVNPENEDARVLLETLRAARSLTEEYQEGGRSSVFSAVPTEPLKREALRKDDRGSILAGTNTPTTPTKERRVVEARSRSRLMGVHRAIKAKDRDAALNVLVQMVEEDENDEKAWFLLGHMAPTVSDQRVALENVLLLNPDNKQATRRLENLKTVADDSPFEASVWQEDKTLLKYVEGFIKVSEEDKNKLESIEKSLREEVLSQPMDDDQEESPKIYPVSQAPTLSLVRIAVWPTVLFMLLTVVQTVMKPLAFSPTLILGILSVFVGSVLAAAVIQTPRHPLWVDFFGQPGEREEKIAAVVIGILGWMLAVGPFILFFIHAFQVMIAYFTS